MYQKRIKVFVIFSVLFLAVCVFRLAQMQLLTASSVQHEIAGLKLRRSQSKQFKTIRGRILDRKGNVLATDEVRFWVHIDYELSSFLDERVQRIKLARAAKRRDPDAALAKADKEIRDKLEDLHQIIEKCAQFKAVEPSVIWDEIRAKNDYVWDQRIFHAWRRKFPNSEVRDDYESIKNVPISKAIADFEKELPDPNERLRLIGRVDIMEMYESRPLLELKTDDDVFAAQLEFMDTDGIQILPKGQRFYPYRTVAAQTIGWVGPATQQRDKELFADDRLLSYLDNEVCGKRPGTIEYVCESILRGRRGEETKDIDGRLTGRTETQFGKDVALTLDIELQQRIEEYLLNYEHAPNLGEPGISAVVIDVGSSDILALVSLPVFDLNSARYDYGDLLADPDNPLTNRAIYEQYPPGSVVKPLILVAGLETGRITPEKLIDCLPEPAPENWPNCLIFRRDPRAGHNNLWNNYARNAIKGSCNIYFSQLANMIEPENLQRWLFAFGYGQHNLFLPASLGELNPGAPGENSIFSRDFRQSSGVISSGFVTGKFLSFKDVPVLRKSDRRWFGIGQGDLRVTPLQVANAMAAIARDGWFRLPRLVLDRVELSPGAPGENEELRIQNSKFKIQNSKIDLGISAGTMDVNESQGTANKQFGPFLSTLAEQDVKVYGKTGSTENPEHAWFTGFAADSGAGKIAIAVVVEGGQRGSSDVAPLARDIIQFCIEAGYVGTPVFEDESFRAASKIRFE
ncbi:MAG: penicillin-binding transpeptidase domain-containing protein [Planctomycetota bacterium]|jgi:penicillin-binding protein 2